MVFVVPPKDTITTIVKSTGVGDYIIEISESKSCFINIHVEYHGSIHYYVGLMSMFFNETMIDTANQYLDLDIDIVYDALYSKALDFIKEKSSDNYYNIVHDIQSILSVLYFKVFVKGEKCSQELFDYVSYLVASDGDLTEHRIMNYFKTGFNAPLGSQHVIDCLDYMSNIDKLHLLCLIKMVQMMETCNIESLEYVNQLELIIGQFGDQYTIKPINVGIAQAGVEFVDFELETV